MSDEPLSLQLARHINALQFGQLSPEVVGAAKLHVLDSIGCLLAGTRLEPGKLAYRLASESNLSASDGKSTLPGSGGSASYLDAVQAMSVAAHCGEMDDIHSGAGICIGGMIVPALLGTAEKHGGTGRSFLEAAIAGY